MICLRPCEPLLAAVPPSDCFAQPTSASAINGASNAARIEERFIEESSRDVICRAAALRFTCQEWRTRLFHQRPPGPSGGHVAERDSSPACPCRTCASRKFCVEDPPRRVGRTLGSNRHGDCSAL